MAPKPRLAWAAAAAVPSPAGGAQKRRPGRPRKNPECVQGSPAGEGTPDKRKTSRQRQIPTASGVEDSVCEKRKPGRPRKNPWQAPHLTKQPAAAAAGRAGPVKSNTGGQATGNRKAPAVGCRPQPQSPLPAGSHAPAVAQSQQKQEEQQPPRGRRGKTTAQRDKGLATTPDTQNKYMLELAKIKKALQKARREHALLEAYEADGWRGASREKVKPVAELAKARAKVVRCQADIRGALQVMDAADGDAPIAASSYGEDGELDQAEIFCAKCRDFESTDDNDIILCDGECRRAYHQLCVQPPIDLSALEDDTEPWLCPACHAKDHALAFINEEFGTEYGLEHGWADVFPPESGPAGRGASGEDARRGSSAADVLLGQDLPSEDEEDGDYRCGESEDEGGGARRASDDDRSSCSSGEGSEDGGDSELEEEGLVVDPEQGAIIPDTEAQPGKDAQGAEQGEGLVLTTKRRRTKVDYRALNQEMFGDFECYNGEEEEEEDGDWGPTAARAPRGRKRQR
eukprot:jgi/Tetstr1/447459/TSEL_003717.t1